MSPTSTCPPSLDTAQDRPLRRRSRGDCSAHRVRRRLRWHRAHDRSPEVVEVGGVDRAAKPRGDEDGRRRGGRGAGRATQEPKSRPTRSRPAPSSRRPRRSRPRRRAPTGGTTATTEDEVEDDAGGNAGDDAAAAENDPGNGRDGEEEPPPPAQRPKAATRNNGLDVLGTDCTNSQLEPHDGFEEAPRCVDTSFGEVAAEEKSPSLLITEAPEAVGVDQEFTISVSTRNLIRDRFLGAAAGGYYLESSFLNGDGIQRGHFHTACRMLESTARRPDAAPDPGVLRGHPGQRRRRGTGHGADHGDAACRPRAPRSAPCGPATGRTASR